MRLLLVAVYFALIGLWVYAHLDRSREYGMPQDYVLPVWGLHLLIGLALGRWWAFLLPIGAILVSIPAGDSPGGDSPVAVWVATHELYFGLPLVLLGVLLARILRWRRTPHPDRRRVFPR